MPKTKLWHPSATKESLVARAKLIQQIRDFFNTREVLEVSTPVLSKTTTTDVQIDSFKTDHYFLQTSPEFYLKRLLAADLGAIYQMGPVFRRGEEGKKHQPEFTLLEWYRPGFLLENLIQEVSDLLVAILKCDPITCLSYQFVFEALLGCQPHLATDQELAELAVKHQIISAQDIQALDLDKDGWLDLLMVSLIEPKLSLLSKGPIAITHYPASQCAYAQTEAVKDLEGNTFSVAHRFEVYLSGLELANGYFELLDARLQREKFNQDNLKRTELGLNAIPIDENLLAAQENGMPSCSGVALGVDRFIMLALNKATIQEVVAFDASRY